MKKYWAIGNHYETQTSPGFSNTDFVTFFADKNERDSWVSRGMARSIPRKNNPLVSRAQRLFAEGAQWFGGEGEPLNFNA